LGHQLARTKKKNSEMDSCIIRIYRRNADKPETILGVLETASDGIQRPFHSRDELWNLLVEAPSRDKKIKEKDRQARQAATRTIAKPCV
jgi:uncharacterized membrane protein